MLAGVGSLTVYVIPDSNAAERMRRDVGPNTNAAYQKECGGCHFPHQPGWLPERSWRELMGSLNRHFGESVGLAAPAREEILAHLVANSADRKQSLRSIQVLASLPPGPAPVSISQVPYVAGIHGGYLDPAFKPKPAVKSLVNCSTCHTRAASGIFSAVTYTVTDESFRYEKAPSFQMPKV
jgi:hypothetical protein